jgi:hypothetical protein
MLNRGEPNEAIRPFEDLPGSAQRDEDPCVAAVRSAGRSGESRDR